MTWHRGWGCTQVWARWMEFARAGTKAVGLGAIRVDLGSDVALEMGCNGWVGSSAEGGT